METLTVQTRNHTEFIDISGEVQASVRKEGLQDGVVIVYVPHTTAGITINEDADPSVIHDILADLDRLVAWRQGYYHHMEGNSAAHTKSSLVGSSQQVIIDNGKLALGRWQGIYFCEFDGPRTRKVYLQYL